MTTVTILFVVIAVIMCIAIVANVIVLASMKSQVSQDYADTLTNAVRDQYLAAIEEYLDGKEITDDVLEQIKEDVIKALNTSAAAVAGTETIFSTAQIVAVGKAPHPTARASSSRQRTRTATAKDTSSPTPTSCWKCAPLRAEAVSRGEAALRPPTLS